MSLSAVALAISSSTPPLNTNKENVLLWASTAIGLALLPLGFGALIKWLFPDLKLTWLKLFGDGQLFFFATSLSADSLNRLVDADQGGIATSLSLTIYYVALGFIILVSACSFALAVFVETHHSQFRGSSEIPGSSLLRPKPERLALVSLGCAIGAIILSLFVFLLGGAQ